MTYIEFFDKTSVVNICACLTNVPERVVFIGGDLKPMQRQAERYQQIFANRGHNIEFICKSVNKNSLSCVVETLKDIVNTYDNIAVDLTGGEDLMLVAMGIIQERYKDKHIQLHRFNARNNTIFDCDADGCTIQKDSLSLTVEENIRAYGGDIVYVGEKENTTYLWDMNEEFIKDIANMWDICKENVRLWNTQIGVLEAAESCRLECENPLITEANISAIKEKLAVLGAKYITNYQILNSLNVAGLIAYHYDNELITIGYKNEQVKRCLTKAGQILEMKVFSIMKSLESEPGVPYYDAMNGVFIDWDGRIHSVEENACDTENEIDIVAMKGIVPVFISCKNGYISTDELYKLKSVAERFGGEYSRKILIATAIDDSKDHDRHFRQRADDMNIRIIDNFVEMTDREMEKVLKNVWH